MPKFDFIKRLIPEMVEDVSKTRYNKSAINTLRQSADEEARLAQELAAMDKGSFSNTINLDPSEFKSLPATAETGFDLVGGPQSKDFILGEASDIARPPVPFKAPEVEAPKHLPVPFKADVEPNLAGATIPLSPHVAKLEQQKRALAALGIGGGIAGGALMLNINQPLDQAASMAPKVPEPERDPAYVPPMVPAEAAEVPKSETEKALERMQGRGAISRSPSIKDIDFGANSSASMDGFKDAQERSRQATLGANLGRIGAAFATGASGVKNNFDEMNAANVKAAGDIPDQYIKQVQFEKEDPNSAMSQGYKEIAKSMGFNIKGQASAADLERIIPQLSNIYNQEQARIARGEEMNLRLAMSKDARKERQDLKTSLQQEKDIENIRKSLDSGTYQKMKQAYNTAGRMQSAIAEFAKNPSGYSDYGTLMGGLKVLQGDESVVREAEIRLGMNAGSLSDKIKNYASQIATGKSLQPRQREEIIRTVKTLSEISRNNYLREIAPFLKTAERKGLPMDELLPEDLVQQRQSQKEKQPAGKTVVRKGFNAKTNQTQFVYSDGTKEIVDGRR